MRNATKRRTPLQKSAERMRTPISCISSFCDDYGTPSARPRASPARSTSYRRGVRYRLAAILPGAYAVLRGGHVDVEHGRQVQRHKLREEQAAYHHEAERLPCFAAR